MENRDQPLLHSNHIYGKAIVSTLSAQFVGEDIEKRQYENRYGSHFYENVSKDLRKALDLTRGMSESTIRYTHYFYCLYSQLIGNRQQDAEVFQVIFNIPWTHHMCIIDKVKGDAKKGLFFARKSLENNRGRAVLLNFLSSDLYERQDAAQTNFALTIPAPESDLAQELLKSPYDFTFLPGKERYQEAELKDALIEHITRFLVELGKGFSYVGKEYRLVAGGKEKNTVLARYALSTINRPMGISEYEVARQQLPDDLKNALPSPEEIEQGLMDK